MSGLTILFIAAGIGAAAGLWIAWRIKKGQDAERDLRDVAARNEILFRQRDAAANAPRTPGDLSRRLRDKRRPF